MNNDGITLLAGPFGTLLIEDYLAAGRELTPSEAMSLLLSDPSLGADIARRYAEAGADIVYAPTLLADRLSPQLNTLRQVVSFNTRALKSAAAAAPDALVSSMLTFIPSRSLPAATDVLTEQASILADAGADMHTIETLTDADSARAAIEAVMEAGVKTGRELPIHISFAPSGPALTIPDATFLAQYSPASAGVNCFFPPSESARLTATLRRDLPDTPLSLRAAVSFPGKERVTPESLADIYREVLSTEAAPLYIGVCCGGSPRYITKLQTLLTNILV